MLLLLFINTVVGATRYWCEVLGNGTEVGQKDVYMTKAVSCVGECVLCVCVSVFVCVFGSVCVCVCVYVSVRVVCPCVSVYRVHCVYYIIVNFRMPKTIA